MYSSRANVIRVAGCIRDSSVDGPGVRYVVFFQGCPHNCYECHNVHTHDWNSEDAEDITVKSIIKDFKENAIAPRVTISGGEPFGQPQALLALVKELNEIGVTDIWVYTGYTIEELSNVGDSTCNKEILDCISVLVDGRFKFNETENAEPFAGSANQRVIKLSERRQGK